MITCPKCGAKLPEWQNRCQFCQEPVDPIVHGHVGGAPGSSAGAPTWVWVAYYVISVYYILEGIRVLLSGFIPSLALSAATERPVIGPIQVFQMVIGLLTILFGAGLVARIEVVRGIANIICWILIVLGFLNMAGSFMVSVFSGPLGLLVLFLGALRIATAAFMIYLISETDQFAPNY